MRPSSSLSLSASIAFLWFSSAFSSKICSTDLPRTTSVCSPADDDTMSRLPSPFRSTISSEPILSPPLPSDFGCSSSHASMPGPVVAFEPEP